MNEDKVLTPVEKTDGWNYGDLVFGINTQLDEGLSLTGPVYDVVMLGGSIGSKSIRKLSHLSGEEAMGKKVYVDRDEAKAAVKRFNKMLSPGEKKHYGLKYVVAEVKDGKYTGK